MARYQKGAPGRPKGAKDKYPRTGRAAINRLLEEFALDPDLLRTALLRGLGARAPASLGYAKLLIEQRLGAPEQTVSQRTIVVHEHQK